MAELEVPPQNGDVSALAWLRQRHEALSAERHLDMPVPGYEGRLAIRCRPVPWATIARVQTLMGKDDVEGRGLLAAQADVLIAACTDVLLDGRPIDPSGEPRRFDPALAGLLGIADVKSARAIVFWMYPSEVAVAVAAGEVLEWTSSATAEASDEFVGE